MVKKVRYRTKESLGPPATPHQLEIITSAFREGRVKIGGKALRYVTGVWLISVDKFVNALCDHLHSGCRFFRKYKIGTSELLPDKLEASVWIREPDEEDDFDDGTVYVELVIRGEEVILIFDAHEHEAGMLRLPR